MAELALEHRDYTVIVAKTAANQHSDPPGFAQRWEAAHAAIANLVQTCQTYDPDGITLYISSQADDSEGFRCYQQVTNEQILSIINQNYPPDHLDVVQGLQMALASYFEQKAAGTAKPNGAIILVLIDGEPRDRRALVQTVVGASEQLNHDEELGIGFALVGDNVIAKGFFTSLDDDLHTYAGAKFDIVHTQVLDEIQPDCLSDFLLKILRD